MEGGAVLPDAGGARRRRRVSTAARVGTALLFAAAVLLGPAKVQAQGAAPPAPAAEGRSQPQNQAPPQGESQEAPAAPAQAQGQEQDKAAAQGEGADNTANINLPGVNVEGKRNVFNDNDKKLKQLQDSLPCTGCDAKPHTKKKFVKRVLDAVGDRVLPTEAPDHSTHDANDKALEFSQQGNCTGANVKECVPANAQP